MTDERTENEQRLAVATAVGTAAGKAYEEARALAWLWPGLSASSRSAIAVREPVFAGHLDALAAAWPLREES